MVSESEFFCFPIQWVVNALAAGSQKQDANQQEAQ
jgi:hypothetical protein